MGSVIHSDMRDFVDALDPPDDLPESDLLAADFFGHLVRAATAATVRGMWFDSAVRCTGCAAHVRVLLTDVPERLVWQCSGCEEEGDIQNWRESPWDLSQAATRHYFSEHGAVLLSEDSYGVLLDVMPLQIDTERLVMGAEWTRAGIELSGPVPLFGALAEHLEWEAACEPDDALRRQLDILHGVIAHR